MAGLNYQTGVQATQATNPGALAGLLKSPARSPLGSATGQRAAQQFFKQNALNDWGQMSTSVQQANAQQFMSSQKLRSEAAMNGLEYLNRVNSDFNERARNQASLGADVQASNLGYQFGAQAAALRRAANIRRNNP